MIPRVGGVRYFVLPTLDVQLETGTTDYADGKLL